MDVAVVDYRSATAARDFTRSLRETGFAVLVNHPIDYAMVQRLQREWLDFFRSERKWDFLPGEGGQDGYRPMEEAETAVGYSKKDIKEYFHWYPWGRQPEAESRVAREMYDAGFSLAAELLSWVEEFTPTEISKHFTMPLSEMINGTQRTLLRILHYPPLRGDEPEGSVRAAAHQDINMITVLPASNEPGLQVRDLSGKWHDVPCRAIRAAWRSMPATCSTTRPAASIRAPRTKSRTRRVTQRSVHGCRLRSSFILQTTSS